MKLKIAICDDEKNQIEYLSGVVSAWASKNRHVAELKTYSSAKSFLFDYLEEKDFDILLLDIEMPGMTGVELAKTVRKENSTVQIIFITGYYEYFSDGFHVSALHYLIKPADERKLFPPSTLSSLVADALNFAPQIKHWKFATIWCRT